MPQKSKLYTLLGDYPNTTALKTGVVTSGLVDFAFADVKVSNTAFKPLVREAKFDLGELAIVTYLQAKTYGKPYVLIPATVLGRGQHHTIAYNPERGRLSASDLAGKRVGVRAYTQTTGAWVRGFLADDHKVDPAKIHWVTFEDPHLAEYKDPDFVTRAPEGKSMVQMLIDGELDAAIVGDKLPDPRLAPLIEDADSAARTWAERHGGIPINHMMVIRSAIAKSRPDVVSEIYRVLRESRRAVPPPADGSLLDPWRFGVEPNRRSLEIIIDYSFRQKLIPRAFSVDELFDGACALN
ncbi:MAG TPA: phosphate ABC transporter substrate-binding protein [Pseudolabrys sp.]|jgi:4,5-dihydroxyphthalate decarboxylase|nr:phosphate ABC transporter substrate-binding protein [Pseudolabrys sp.]